MLVVSGRMSHYDVRVREACRFCGGTRLSCFYTLPDQPLTSELLDWDAVGREFRYPIRVYFCESCHLSQTLHDIDAQGYYQGYEYSVAASAFARNFMKRLANAIWKRYEFAPGDPVVEIGSGDGSQLIQFAELARRAGVRI